MPKYVCPGCSKILIRNANLMRTVEFKSVCQTTGKPETLRRLRIVPAKKKT